MSKYATKKATKQLQKIFDVLGEFGGVIETDDPRCYWSLDLEVEEIEGDIKTIQIGVFSDINGDIIYDPLFHLSLRCENGKIMETEIIECEETTLFGTCIIDNNDLIHGFGLTENDPYGLQKRFSSFMDNMTERGSYLRNPKEIKRYHKTLAD